MNEPEKADASARPPLPRRWWSICLYGLFLIGIPLLSFYTVGEDLHGPDWQSGRFSDYVTLLLYPEAALLFLILLGYSILCYLVLAISPTRSSRLFLVRLGIYTGVLLALQYWIISIFIYENIPIVGIVLTWIFPLVYSKAYRWGSRKWGEPRIIIATIIVIVSVIWIGLRAATGSEWMVFVIFAPFIAGPVWSLMLAAPVAVWLLKNHETKLTWPRGAGLAAWLGAYAAAWRYDILKMHELYAALPVEQPDCFIATAAARGHPRFVGSRALALPGGRTLHVNRQLQRLKSAELGLMAAAPALHAGLRGTYDWIGKSLAGRLSNPYLADIAYLLLKPFEWSALLILRVLLPEIDLLSRKLYCSQVP